MKKLILIFMVLFSISAYTQNFGFKGGLNVSSIGGDSQGVSSKTSFHAGIFFLGALSESFKIMPEFIYSVQGASAGTLIANYNYINIPIMFNYYPRESFFFQAGPQLGILASAEATNGTNTQNVKSQLKDTDFSLCMGIGGELSNVILNARYNLGLSSTSKQSGNFPNNVFQISVGFKLTSN
jgi:hypothetical protein